MEKLNVWHRRWKVELLSLLKILKLVFEMCDRGSTEDESPTSVSDFLMKNQMHSCGWRWPVFSKGYNWRSLCLQPTLVQQIERQSIDMSVYILNLSEVQAYRSASDSSISIPLSTSAPFKCKHRLHTVTGHFIFKEVKGHSTWQHSIAYSSEMNQDGNRIDN